MLLSEGLRFSDRTRFTSAYGYFLPWKNAMVASLEKQNVEVTCFGARNTAAMLLHVRRVARHLRAWKADLLHCHMPMAGVVGRVAGRLAKIPVMYTEHNKMERFHPITKRLNLATWRWQEQVVAVSNDVARSIRAHANADVPVQVVPNGINVDYFHRNQVDPLAVRRRFGISAEAPVVGTVAVFRAQKRLQDWLEAARHMRARHADSRFLLVGDGPLREELLRHTAELGLEDVVHFAGLQDDVRPYIVAMDVYLMSSLFEGLPLALLEAMSMECPVVSTAVGGIPEVIRDGHNGFLVEPGNPELLAHVVGQVLSSPETLRQCGQRARTTVVEQFSMRRMIRDLESMYVHVVSRYRDDK